MPEAEAIQKRSYQGVSAGQDARSERPATEHGEPFAGLGEMARAATNRPLRIRVTTTHLSGMFKPGDHFGGECVGLVAG